MILHKLCKDLINHGFGQLLVVNHINLFKHFKNDLLAISSTLF